MSGELRPDQADWRRVELAPGLPLLVRADAHPAEAAVLVVHGGGVGYSKEWAARELGAIGRSCHRLYVDLPLHGERGGDHVIRARYRRHTLEGFLRPVVLGMAEDLSRVADFAERELGVPAGRLGLFGWSLGGLAALVAAARDPRFAAAAVFAAPSHPAYLRLEDGLEPAPPLATLAEFDATARAHLYPPRALLVGHGRLDTWVPVAAARNFVEALRPGYAACPERLAYLELSELAHDPTDVSTAERRAASVAFAAAVTAWFDRFLTGAS